MAFAILSGWLAVAQEGKEPIEQPIPERDPKAKEKIEAARIGMITNKLGLTPEQAEKFWPIYREFSEKRMGLRKEFNTEKEKIKFGSATPEEQKKLVEEKQKEVFESIRYAKRIQMAQIPSEKMVNKILERIKKK